MYQLLYPLCLLRSHLVEPIDHLHLSYRSVKNSDQLDSEYPNCSMNYPLTLLLIKKMPLKNNLTLQFIL